MQGSSAAQLLNQDNKVTLAALLLNLGLVHSLIEFNIMKSQGGYGGCSNFISVFI